VPNVCGNAALLVAEADEEVFIAKLRKGFLGVRASFAEFIDCGGEVEIVEGHMISGRPGP
jgi:hypothetical protein